jgi:hypothetical protein
MVTPNKHNRSFTLKPVALVSNCFLRQNEGKSELSNRLSAALRLTWPIHSYRPSRPFIQLIVLTLTAPSVLAAPTGTSDNPAGTFKKRAYNLTYVEN